jgi:hypothetical protein
MKTRFKISVQLSLILGIFSFGCLIYNFFVFQLIRPTILNFESLGTNETLIQYIFIGFIVSFLFHIWALFNSIFQFQYFKKITFIKLITLFAAILSFICLIGDWAALSDLGKQYQLGLSTAMEWSYLYLSLLLHGLFHILIIILLFYTIRDLKSLHQPEYVLKDEIIFKITQYIGLLCGSIGLGFTLVILIMNIPLSILKYIIPFYCSFIIFPYCLILFYWIMMKRKEKISDWYDEKQKQDIARASLITTLLFIPGTAVLFLINYLMANGSISVIWFPYYLFLMLFLFSASMLYYNRKSKNISIVEKWRSFSFPQKVFVFILPSGVIAITLLYAVSCTLIFSSVKSICDRAKKEFNRNNTESLMALIESEKLTFEEKNNAIWALGQIGDKTSLPLLENLYTGDICNRCNRKQHISLYELKKAIKFINSDFVVTRWMYRRL